MLAALLLQCDDPLPVEQEATIARGTLALANLTQPSAVCHASALGLCQDSPTFTPSNKVALETIVKVLDHAVTMPSPHSLAPMSRNLKPETRNPKLNTALETHTSAKPHLLNPEG